MYYLLNQTNQIIAADEPLLALCGVSHIDELTSKIILGDTSFDVSSENQLIINSDQTYVISKTSLSSMLGDLTLVTVGVAESVKNTSTLPEAIPEDNFLNDFSIKETIEEPETIIEEKETTPIDLDSNFTLIKSDEDEKESENFLLTEEKPSTSIEEGEILIDIKTISQSMGVSHEDYNAFLDEYIDTALGLESDLKSNTEETRIDAISTLSQLGDVLHLPTINTIINKLSSASNSAQTELIASFYNTLSRLTTQSTKQDNEIHFDLLDMSPNESETAIPENKNSFGSISLDGIKPIHFDFQLEEAANDLSLPVELIEEFVNDFIEQAHIETKKMLESYEKGDLDAIQKIGHLLKGASSNLRINALSDTLYQIQFCEDPSNLEAFIKEYWGHFLSFEIQIHALAK